MSVLTIGEDKVVLELEWKAYVGECPVWSVHEQKLYWVDILKNKIFCFHPQTKKNEVFELPEIVPCIGLRGTGGLVVALKKGFAFYDPDSRRLTLGTTVEKDQPGNRFNDGKVDPQGRFWAGTMDAVHWKEPAGHLFRLDPDGSIHQMVDQVICSNGTAWSPDSKTMYYTESFRYTVFAYDFDAKSGAISNRRKFIEIDPKSGGFPDGLTVDSEGFVWSNIVGLGQIHRYDPEGRLERIIQCPVPRATSCAFGGEDLQTLYITSSYETLNEEQMRRAPLSGSLFSIYTEVKGLPSPSYEG